MLDTLTLATLVIFSLCAAVVTFFVLVKLPHRLKQADASEEQTQTLFPNHENKIINAVMALATFMFFGGMGYFIFMQKHTLFHYHIAAAVLVYVAFSTSTKVLNQTQSISQRKAGLMVLLFTIIGIGGLLLFKPGNVFTL